MRAVYSLRMQVEALPGIGQVLSRTFLSLVDAINTPPIYVGEAALRSGPLAPETRVAGNVGDLYLCLAGGSGTTLYVKESGGNTATGWVGK